MRLASDNTGPALPQVMDAVIQTNSGHLPSYGSDEPTQAACDAVRAVFEAPDAAVQFVATGTAANSISLACLTQPWQTVFCTPLAHIQIDECHAPEFYTGGARLSLVGTRDKMTADELEAAITALGKGDVHVSQPGSLSLTQVTELGQLYTLDELRALSETAHAHGLPVHMDGARFANACAALDVTAAQMSHQVGVDVVSFGASKNGCFGVEAIVMFDDTASWEAELRRKRGGHLFSKHRFLAAQMLGYLKDGAWLKAACTANARAARLVAGLQEVPGCVFDAMPQANMIFARLPRATHQRLHAGGAVYGLFEGPLDGDDPDEALLMRCVCDWSITNAQIDDFVALAKG